MSTNDHFRINTPKIVHETIDDETVILNLDNGNYYSLDGIGADIWGFIEKNANIKDVIGRLQDNYEGDRGEIKNVVNKFVSELMQEGLTVADDGEPPEGSNEFKAQDETGRKEKKSGFEAPTLNKYNEMQDLLLLDPIHEVDETGWPTAKKDLSSEK
jgi:hypothetical protein